jgi:PGF-CTERM protein
MYDVNFGGKEHMTKRLTIALVAVALFVLMAVMPVSAAENGTVINATATVFIGEQGLNLTHALNQANGVAAVDGVPTLTTIGWWASAAQLYTSSPTKTIDLGTGSRYLTFTVAPSDFVGYTGNWYLLAANGTTPASMNAVVVAVADPTLDIKVWDVGQNADVTGKSVPQGTNIRFQIDTNMYPAVDVNKRTNIIAYGTTTNATVTQIINNIAVDSTGVWSNGTTPVTTSVTYTNTSSWGGLTTWGAQVNTQTRMFYYHEAAAFPGAYNFTTDAAATIVATDVTQASLTTVTVPAAQFAPLAATDGYIDIKVKDESGTTFTALYNQYSTWNVPNVTSLLKNFVNTQPYQWGINNPPAFGAVWWNTNAVDFNNQYAYPVGTYTVSAESKLNKMKDNYKNAGADYTGKTVSQSYTVTLVSDTVKIEANKDSVVRSKSFSVTITGKPSTNYYLWVKGTSNMGDAYDTQPPMINLNQLGVTMDPAIGPYTIGAYAYENGAGKTIKQDVAAAPWNGTRYYAQVGLSTSGTRTVEWITTNWTKAQKYTIRVENTFDGRNTFKTDEVDVKVEKGAVTIVAAGDQSYYLGEEIKFSGTNTESYKTYLFIIGPNLPTNGAMIQPADLDPRAHAVVNQQPNTFKVIDVQGDNTWSWKWGTSNIALDAGTYTVYAVSQPNDKNNLQNAAYGTVSIIIKKPFVSATASQSTVAKGDRIYITGTAEGQPKAVQIWILGKNKAIKATESVNSDASFKYEVTQETTKNLYAGQYFVVVQHPMQNDDFDVDTCTAGTGPAGVATPGNYVCNMQQAKTTANAQTIFTLLGAGSLQGSDAAEALVQGINSANVDDTYTKLQFLIEEPVFRIDAIGDKRVGDKFTITAQTNLAVDDEILVQVYSSSFKPTQKSQSGEFSGATGTVKVTKGDSGMNKISFDVDSSTFKPDEYIVTAEAIIQTATGTALFNVLDGQAPVVTTTPVVVTTAATAVPTQVPTQAPTAVPTTQSPGYGALIALIGLGAVAFIVVRRH